MFKDDVQEKDIVIEDIVNKNECPQCSCLEKFIRCIHCYKCQFCQRVYKKELWGVGRIWCPNCQQQQLSPYDKLRKCKVCNKQYNKNDNHWLMDMPLSHKSNIYHKFIPGELIND